VTCPACGLPMESCGEFDGTLPSAGVTSGHHGFGDTYLCERGHWWTLIQGQLVPPEHILTVLDQA
jgi:hypothetical protein